GAAALHLLAPIGAHLDLGQNFSFSGQGIDHTFSEITRQGSIENLRGINTIYGNVAFAGQAGVGVESVFGASQLTLLGEQSQIQNASLVIPAAATGSSTENDNIIDTGATTGTVTVN